MRAMKHFAATVLARTTLGLTLFAGCTGQMGEEMGTQPDGTGVPSTGGPHKPGGNTGSTGGTNTGGTGPGMTAPAAMPGSDPGRVALHRLSATQYNNTVADLLGTSLRPGDKFPSDFGGEMEFDTNASRLSVSPVIVGVHEQSVDELIEEAWKTPQGRSRILGCDPAAGASCVREMVNGFGLRAWRRPLLQAEADKLVALFDVAKTKGATPEEGAKAVARAILLSPKFLYRMELDPEPMATKARPLTGYELASRLSYFLWNSMPDEALFAAAKANKLGTAPDIKMQVDRMLGSPKAEAFVRSFAGQWTATIELEKHDVEAKIFTGYDAPLAQAMKREVELFFGSLVSENRPVSDLLLANHTFVNARLAKHYGLPAPATDWAKVDIKNTPRGGLLGLGGMLMATSNPERTSVVKRGVYVAEAVLCTEFPSAPPDVPPLPEGSSTTGTTQRERLEIHRRDPACFACHQLIDPIGFGLEKFDAIGAFRELELGKPIDDSGKLPEGTVFNGTRELSQALSKDGRASVCFIKTLSTYALGRHMHDSDKPYLAALAGPDARAVGMKELITRIATSDLFRFRRAAPDTDEGGAP